MGGVSADGSRQLAFLGNVTALDGREHAEVFLAELPVDLTRTGAAPARGHGDAATGAAGGGRAATAHIHRGEKISGGCDDTAALVAGIARRGAHRVSDEKRRGGRATLDGVAARWGGSASDA